MNSNNDQELVLDIDEVGLVREVSATFGLSTVLAREVIDDTYYLLGMRNGNWAFAYGKVDREYGFCFSSIKEVGAPYVGWFEKTVINARLSALSGGYADGDVPIRFTYFIASHRPLTRDAAVPASVILAVGFVRAFHLWLKQPLSSLHSWDAAAMPQKVPALSGNPRTATL